MDNFLLIRQKSRQWTTLKKMIVCQ